MIADRLRKSVIQFAIMGNLTVSSESEEVLEYYKTIIKSKGVKFSESKLDSLQQKSETKLPHSWKLVKLGDVVDIFGGKRLPVGRKLVVKNTGHRYITVSDMKNRSVNIHGLKYIPEDIYDQIKRYYITSNDIYITVAGTIGRVGIIPDEISGSNLTENANKLVFENLNKKWLLYVLESSYVQNQIYEATTQVGQPKLAIKRIRELIIPLTSLREQQEIVNIIEKTLPLIDDLEAIEHNLKTLENGIAIRLKNSILKSAFEGKLVEINSHSYAYSELNEHVKKIYDKNKNIYTLPFDIPDNWISIPLTTAFEYIKTGVPKFSNNKLYYSTGSVKDELIPEGEYSYKNRPSRANRIVLKGDIIEAKMSNTIKAIIIDDDLHEQLVSTGFFQIRIDNPITRKYVYYFLQSPYFVNTKNELSSGTTQKAINDLNLNKILIPIPPLEEQEIIVDKIEELLKVDLFKL